MDLEQLRADLRALLERMTALSTAPEDLDDVARSAWDMSEEDTAAFDALDTEATALRDKIRAAEQRLETIAASRAVLGADDAAGRGRLDPPNVNRNPDPYDLETLRFDATLQDLRARAEAGLAADDVTPDTAKVEAMRTLANVKGDKASVAKRYLMTGSVAYRSAFAKAICGNDWALTDAERHALARAQALSPGSAGGFAVPFTLDPTIIGIDGGSINPFRRIGRVVQTTTDSWNGVTGTAAAFSYDQEAEAVSDDSITLAQAPIPVYNLRGFIPFSFEAGDDWAAIDSDLRNAMMEGRDNREALAHAKGTGTNEPTGIETALTGTASEIAPGTAETFAGADVYNLQRLLPPKHRQASPTWVLDIGTANDIRQFDTAGGGQFWASLAAGAPPSLLGWAWEEASEIDSTADLDPAVTATNKSLYNGNWSRFVIVDRVGMTVELIQNLFDPTTGRPTGQRGLFGHMRSGSNVSDANAFRMLSIPTTA